MKKFFVHVIDDASQHEKTQNGTFKLIQGTSNNIPCDILRSDCLYFTEAETAIDAVTNIANEVRITDSEGMQILLSAAFINTQKELVNVDFDSADNTIDDIDLKISLNGYEESFLASCQIPMEKDGESWIEFHKVYFYVIEDTKIIKVQSTNV